LTYNDTTAQIANLERAMRDVQAKQSSTSYLTPLAQGIAKVVMNGTNNITLNVPVTNLQTTNNANLTFISIQGGLPATTIANAHIALIGECTPGKLIIHAHPTNTITGTIGVSYLIY